MNCNVRLRYMAAALAALVISGTPVFAVPFASGVRNTSGTNWEFITNETADNVTVLRDGANPLDLGALAAGRHTFSMAGFNSFDIRVSKSAPAAWTPISSSANLFTNFERPNDVVVNKDPSNPMFGTVYVINGDSAATVSGRSMGDGVYALTSDLIGVDLPTRAAIADPNDVSAAKAPGWTVDQSNASPWRMTLDAAGNLIVSDWSDASGGIKYASPDLTSGGLVLANEDGVRPLLDDGNGQIHGSIVSRPYVTGSVGNNLVVYAMDEDNDFDGVTESDDALNTTGNHVWKWNVGNATGYNQAPELVINTANIPATTEFSDNFLSLNWGIIANATFSPAHNKWYLTESRDAGGEAGLIVVSADGVDGMSPTLDWSSLQFSIDNALDGNNDEENFPGTQDVFRQMGGGMELSADGTKLFLHKLGNADTNTVLGSASNLPGAVVIVPLDANGIPQLQVAGGQITNMDSISTTQGNDAGANRRGVAQDAAGNVYTTNNSAELLEVFSPGGNWVASTTSAGGFSLTPLTAEVDADFDGNGLVDGADFLIWQKGLALAGQPDKSTGDANGDGNVDAADLGVWKNQFGSTASTIAAGAVPEPASAALLALGIAAVGGAARRSRRNSKRISLSTAI